MTVRATIAAVLAGLSMSAHAIADSPRNVDIPAGDLRQALLMASEQFGTDLVFSPGQIKGFTTGGAHGQLTTEQTVTRLLEGTPLELRIDPSGAMLIVPPGEGQREVTTGEGERGAQRPGVMELEEIVVTGSHIRGEAPAGSRVITITGEEIERSGHAQLEDFFEYLPQNFSGSGSEDSSNRGTNFNVNRQTTIDLRGLGSGTTLILVNGHRQPNGDLFGGFVDISSIPSSAVERVEILTDGASAVYGSDAIGGVVNFVLRKDYQGAETRARFGSLDGNADEIQLAQSFGRSWSSGNALLAYQFHQRDPLQARDIPYLATLGDQRKHGGSDWRTFSSNPGVILGSSGLPAYGIPGGQNGTGLTAANLTPLNGTLPAGYPLDALEDNWYLAKQKTHAVLASVVQRVSDRMELFADGRYGYREVKGSSSGTAATFSVPSTNPFYVNPFGGTGPVSVAYNFHDDGLILRTEGKTEVHSEALGLKARFADWQVTLSGVHGEEKNTYLALDGYYPAALATALNSTDPNTALNLFGDGANLPSVIDRIRSSDIVESRMETWGGGVVADGPLMRVLGRDIRLALGADYRAESLDSIRNNYREFTADVTNDRSATASRHISAAFAELAIPLVPDGRGRKGLRRLDLSVAGRYEDYSDFGTTLNPKIGLRWQPIESLQVRGTWGTSFRAPKLIETSPGYSANVPSLREVTLSNPQAPGARWQVLVNVGPNLDLHEETADIWTAGFDLAPASIEGLRVSMSYFDIDYSDRIAPVPIVDAFTSLANFNLYSQFITTSPSQTQVNTLCAQFPGRCSGRSIGVIFNASLQNVSKVLVNGVDLDISQSLDTAVGTFDFGLGGTHLSTYEQTPLTGKPSIDVLDTPGNPLSLRLRGKLSWGYRNWRTGVFVNHADGYNNPAGQPAKVASSTTVDFNLGYQVSAGPDWLNRSRISLSVLNVGDELPPFLNVAQGYDVANGDVAGRNINLLLTKEW